MGPPLQYPNPGKATPLAGGQKTTTRLRKGRRPEGPSRRAPLRIGALLQRPEHLHDALKRFRRAEILKMRCASVKHSREASHSLPSKCTRPRLPSDTP